MSMQRFGVYFYPWYGKNKWVEFSRLHTPAVGEYQSNSLELIEWQLHKICKSGIDYIIFELPPVGDWSFEVCVETIDMMISEIKKEKVPVGYTFLLDVTFIAERANLVSEVHLLLDFLVQKGWAKNIISSVDKKILYVFAPYPDQAMEITRKFGLFYEFYFPATFPHWGGLKKSFGESDLEPYIISAIRKNVSLADDLRSKGYCQFWSPTEHLKAINRISSVIPGYDDFHLGRPAQFMPSVSRVDGKTFFEQFKLAVESGADNILIYGWNEYFEATTIEPTLEYGDFYVELTRRLIEQAKRGEVIHFPDDMGKPERADPIYLSPELERAAQRHHDKVPRWDQDDYVVVIDVQQPAVIEHGHAVFRKVRVTNVGLKPWCIKSECEPIRLGVRILDSSGTVVREGRSELGVRDIGVGECVQVDLKVEVEDLSVEEKYRADIDLVWEEKFWFDCALVNQISIM